MPHGTVLPDTSIPVKGILVSADASTAAAIVLYYSYDSTAYTLTGTQQLYITCFSIVSESALTFDFFDDVATAGTVNTGEQIFGGAVAANGGMLVGLPWPIVCKLGSVPKIKMSGAGNIKVVVHGYAK